MCRPQRQKQSYLAEEMEGETEPVRDKHPFLRGPFYEFITQFGVLATVGRVTAWKIFATFCSKNF